MAGPLVDHQTQCVYMCGEAPLLLNPNSALLFWPFALDALALRSSEISIGGREPARTIFSRNRWFSGYTSDL